jgi:hypothetical protein
MRNGYSSVHYRPGQMPEIVHALAISCTRCPAHRVYETTGPGTDNVRRAGADGWTVFANRGDRCPDCSARSAADRQAA